MWGAPKDKELTRCVLWWLVVLLLLLLWLMKLHAHLQVMHDTESSWKVGQTVMLLFGGDPHIQGYHEGTVVFARNSATLPVLATPPLVSSDNTPRRPPSILQRDVRGSAQVVADQAAVSRPPDLGRQDAWGGTAARIP